MNELKVGDIITLKSESRIKLTITSLLINDRIEAMFWNPSKGEFQTITGDIDAFRKVNE